MKAGEQLNGIRLKLPDSEIIYYPEFLGKQKADGYFRYFLNNGLWQQDDIRVYGKTYLQPRLTALYGNNGKSYSYSNIVMDPHPFDIKLQELKRKLDELTQLKFTSCLMNLYRNGSDSNGWHADDEKELGLNPVIASVSLGEARMFHLKHKKRKELKKSLLLEHGSLLLMRGATQHCWLHQIPKSKKIMNPRINLTFRVIK
ncbi:MAG: alpha-ketoglutarate-dependent dioxygenase AlkB [Flavobacteriaceae bacterium]